MGKAIGIDFGLKRTGFAISDDGGIIASPMEAIDSRNIPDYLDQIILKEIHLVVLGFQNLWMDQILTLQKMLGSFRIT